MRTGKHCPQYHNIAGIVVSNIQWLVPLTWDSPLLPAVDTYPQPQAQCEIFSMLELTTQISSLSCFFITSEIKKKSSNDKPSGMGFFSREKNEIDVSWQELSERFPPPPSVYILCRELYRKMG